MLFQFDCQLAIFLLPDFNSLNSLLFQQLLHLLLYVSIWDFMRVISFSLSRYIWALVSEAFVCFSLQIFFETSFSWKLWPYAVIGLKILALKMIKRTQKSWVLIKLIFPERACCNFCTLVERTSFSSSCLSDLCPPVDIFVMLPVNWGHRTAWLPHTSLFLLVLGWSLRLPDRMKALLIVGWCIVKSIVGSLWV